VIAADNEDLDRDLVQLSDLVGKEAGCLHRRLLAVVKIARRQEGIDLFVEAEVHDADERFSRGVADEIRERGVAQREGAERRVEMDVRRVDGTEGGTPTVRTSEC